MNKKTSIILSICICVAMILALCTGHVDSVYADSENWALLDFAESSDMSVAIRDGKAIWQKEGYPNVEYIVELVTKNSDQQETYQTCVITEDTCLIDLNEKEYYLKIKTSVAVNNPDDIGNIDIPDGTPLIYINETRYNVDADTYVKLDTNMFSGRLEIQMTLSPISPKPQYPDTIEIRALYDGFGMTVYLNGDRIGAEAATITGSARGYATGNIQNLITIQLAFGDGTIGSVNVNGEDIHLPENVGDRIEFTVEPSSSYNIVVKKSTAVTPVPRTIIWAADRRDNSSLKDNELVKNGTVEILEIKDEEGNSVDLSCVKQDLEKNTGMAVVIPGSTVVFRLKPDYGYQLTSVRINDEVLTAGEEQSTFEYVMPDANVHIGAIFEKVDDKVILESSKVREAEITLESGELDSGSAMLSVQDTEVSDEAKNNFEAKAKGYEIASYLKIELNQIIYKGTDTDMWINAIRQLNHQATITLQLAQGVDGDEFVIIHEKQDGTYEVIPTVYDAKSRTITFRTSGFSNYAIAGRQTKDTTEDSSKDTTEDSSKDTTEDGGTTATEARRTTEASTVTTEAAGSTIAAPETEGETTGNAATPGTGDPVNLYACLAFLLIAGIGLTCIIRKTR